MVCCCSSVVERILGKAEVGSSILPSSTISRPAVQTNHGKPQASRPSVRRAREARSPVFLPRSGRRALLVLPAARFDLIGCWATAIGKRRAETARPVLAGGWSHQEKIWEIRRGSAACDGAILPPMRRGVKPRQRAVRVLPEHRRAGQLCRRLPDGGVEARAGIEPAYTDLQSAASPLRHRARSQVCVVRGT